MPTKIFLYLLPKIQNLKLWESFDVWWRRRIKTIIYPCLNFRFHLECYSFNIILYSTSYEKIITLSSPSPVLYYSVDITRYSSTCWHDTLQHVWRCNITNYMWLVVSNFCNTFQLPPNMVISNHASTFYANQKLIVNISLNIYI